MSLDTERRAWIALASIQGVGPVLLEHALLRFGRPSRALAALALEARSGDRRVAAALGLRRTPNVAAAISRAASDPNAAQAGVRALGGWVLTPFDADYRRWLHAISEPAPLLYGIGAREALADARSVAVVGTRRPTGDGRHLAARVVRRLIEAGSVIVSGLAVGIDAVAHRSALEGGGRTIAVIAGGIDAPGPRINARLADDIIGSGGAIVSEHPPGTRPTPGTFPRRNRLISALSRGTVVVEAPVGSGALITARHALEQGRRVLIGPGRPGDRATAGGLELLATSPARPLLDLDRMIVALGLDIDGAGATGSTLSRATALAMLSPAQRAVAEALVAGPASADAISASTGLDPGAVAAAVTLLELRGWASLHGGIHLPAGPLLR